MEKKLGFIDYNVDFQEGETTSCHWWNKPTFSRHYHNYYEIFVVFNGTTNHILNDVEEKIHARTMYIIRPIDIHEATQIGNEPCLHFNVAATQPVFKQACDFLSDELFEQINIEDRISFTLSNKEFNYFNYLANKIHTINSKHSDKKLIKSVYEKQMISYGISLYMEKAQNDINAPQWFEDLLQKINSPKYIDCKTADVYKMSNYCASSLIKFFKLYTGKTVSAYLQDAKINFACNLLETTNWTTLQIASKVGYDSLSHFNNLFKKATGYTPVEYRKRLKK